MDAQDIRESNARDANANKQLVIHAWKEFSSRNAGRIAAVFAPDAEWIAPEGNATAVALGGSHHMIGRDRIVHFLTSEFPTLFVSDVSVDFRGLYADGDTVIVEERMTATLAHGGHYENDYCFLFRLDDGLITQVREYMDTQRGKNLIASLELSSTPSPPSMTSRHYIDGMLEPAVKELATGKNFATFAFLMPDGQIASHVMWVDADDEHLLINTEVHRAKYKAIVENPQVTVTVTVWSNESPYRYAEVRGRVTGEIRGDQARAHIDACAQRYVGTDYQGKIESERVILLITPSRQRTWGL